MQAQQYRHGSSQEFPRLVHSTCTSSAPALEMHSAHVLEMLVQMQCPRSVQVLQQMLRIQEGVTEQLCNIVVSKKCPNRTLAQILTLCVCGLDQRKMAFSHCLEEVPLHDSLLCVGT